MRNKSYKSQLESAHDKLKLLLVGLLAQLGQKLLQSLFGVGFKKLKEVLEHEVF